MNCGMDSNFADLPYFGGGGRFCTSIKMVMGEHNDPLFFLCITSFEVLANLGFHNYVMEPREGIVYFL
jgi:hypothetical protein